MPRRYRSLILEARVRVVRICAVSAFPAKRDRAMEWGDALLTQAPFGPGGDLPDGCVRWPCTKAGGCAGAGRLRCAQEAPGQSRPLGLSPAGARGAHDFSASMAAIRNDVRAFFSALLFQGGSADVRDGRRRCGSVVVAFDKRAAMARAVSPRAVVASAPRSVVADRCGTCWCVGLWAGVSCLGFSVTAAGRAEGLNALVVVG